MNASMTAKKSAPPRKPARSQDNPEQSKRFIETGKALGADKDGEALGRALKKIVSSKPTDH
jgi:hypothetical protein